MSGHGHSHGGGACTCEHRAFDAVDVSEEWLFSAIDTTKITGINEKPSAPAKNCFKPHSERDDLTKFCESDADEQLIINVPFTGMVQLKSIVVSGGPGDTCPADMKCFINKDDIDFDSAESIQATQTVELAPNQPTNAEYPLRMAKFNNVHLLTLYFPRNYGGEVTRINYIGIKGTYKHAKVAAVSATYELKPLVADHKARAETGPGQQIS